MRSIITSLVLFLGALIATAQAGPQINPLNQIQGSLGCTAGTQVWDQSSKTCVNLGSGGNATIPLPLSIYTVGSGMIHITDSTGPGGVYVLTSTPTNGSGAFQCPGTSNAGWGQVAAVSATGLPPFTFYNCSSVTNTWILGLPIGSTTERIFAAFNQQSSQPNSTGDYPYPGTHFSNTGGIINTGNAPCHAVFSTELYPWELPNGDASVTYFNHCGTADYDAWTGAVGFGPETNAPLTIAGTVTAAVMFEGSPKYGLIPAQSSSVGTSGTWTNFNPTTTTTTGTASSGSTTLTVASGASISNYFRVVDVTNSTAIPYGTYVVSGGGGGTTLTLSQNTTASISGDTINFINPQSEPFVGGYAKCATGSGTLTFTAPAANNAVYLAYLVDGTPGTAAATYSVDSGASTGTLSTGDGGTFSNHVHFAWWGKRLPISGTGAHTVAVTVTSGTFCPIALSVPSPATYAGLNPLPRVVQELLPPQGTGYNANDIQLHDAVKAVVDQMASDGYNVVSADVFQAWPEAGGITSYFEHNIGTYTNGIVCSYSASPHFNECGNAFNANEEIAASGIARTKVVPGPTGMISVDNSAAGKQIVDVVATNIDLLNRSQIHTVGNQQINTGDVNKNALIVKGSQTATGVPPLNSIVHATTSGSNCIGSITGSAGDVILVPTITGTTSGVAGTRGETYTLVVTNTSNNNATVWKGTFASSGTSSLTVTSTNCRAATFINVGPSVTVDGTPATNFSSSVPNPFTSGSVTTANPSDLLIDFYMADSFGTGCGNSPTVTSAGWTLSDFNAVSDRISTITSSTVGATPGVYSVSVNPNSTGCNAGHTTLALTGPGTPQSADLIPFQDSGGSTLGAIDKVGKLRSTVYSSETVTFSSTPTFSTSTRYSEIVMTGNITSFTLAAGSVGQEKTLCFIQDGTGSRTVAAPSNVHGFFTVGTTASKANCQHFIYSSNQSAWVADSAGSTNQ